MNNKKARLVGRLIAKKLLSLGDEGSKKCWRIQFRCGEFGNEQPGGGMALEPLARFFAEQLERFAKEVPE